MSWNDQDIDQLFKGAKAPEPAPFQESFWLEMEAMLPAEKRKKAGLWWVASGAATLLLLAGGGFWIANQSTENTDLSGQMKPFLGINRYQTVSNDVDGFVEAAARENNTGVTANTEAQPLTTADISSNNTSVSVSTEQPLPEVIPADNLAESSAMNSAPQTEEPVFVDELPAQDLRLDKPTDLDKYGSLQTNCIDLNQCMLDAVEFPKAPRFYIQASAGIGQSAQHVVGKSDLVHFYTVGGGLYKKFDRMVFTFGANMRVDFTGNILYTTYPSNNTRIDTKYSQLYSFEMPVSMGYEAGRNSIVATVTPGFQTAFSGNQQETQSNVVVRSEQTFGKISNAKTLTMEIGVTYWRTMAPNWYLGLGMNVDILKPFNSTMYAGEQRFLPLNGQLCLRRTF